MTQSSTSTLAGSNSYSSTYPGSFSLDGSGPGDARSGLDQGAKVGAGSQKQKFWWQARVFTRLHSVAVSYSAKKRVLRPAIPVRDTWAAWFVCAYLCKRADAPVQVRMMFEQNVR